MQYSLATLALAATATALKVPRAACSFSLTSSGGQTGTVGQLGDGQVRVGGNYAQSTFSINNGAITDSAGRGCILTPPTTQFQCDVGATPTGGFSINGSGQLTYNGKTTFYACPATNSEYNFYTTPVAGQSKCVTVTLNASGCYAATTVAPAAPVTKTVQAPGAPATVTVTKTNVCPAPSTVTVYQPIGSAPAAPATTAKTSPAPAPQPTAKTCPANLSGSYQYPHLIIPVDSTKPNTAAGTSYNGQVSSTVSSIFNFDIPASYTGTCSLVFLFPQQAQLQTSSYTFSGDGKVDFAQLSSVATQGTTYANQPSVAKDLGVFTVTPGTSTVVSTFACPAGKAVSYELKNAGSTSLTYFQDYNPSPIGLYITTC